MTAGDMLMLKDGTYTTAWDINGKTGTANAYYTIRAATIGAGITRTRGVVLKVTASLPMITVQNSSYVEIRGIKFDANLMGNGGLPTDSGAAVYLTPADSHIRFIDNEIVDSERAGITMSANGPGSTEGSHEIIDNWIHNIGVGTNPAMTHAVYVKLNNTLVEGNRIENTAGWGIHAYNNGTTASGNVFKRNFIKGSGTASQGRGGGSLVYDSPGALVYNNIFVANPTWGLDLGQNGTNVKAYNNTFYNNGNGRGDGAAVYLDPGGTGSQIVNNAHCSDRVFVTDVAGGHTETTNVLCPGFTNAAGDNFTLTAPPNTAINTGTDLGSPYNFDYINTVRPQGIGWDIGAYEYIGGTLPTVVINQPAGCVGNSTACTITTATIPLLTGTSSLP